MGVSPKRFYRRILKFVPIGDSYVVYVLFTDFLFSRSYNFALNVSKSRTNHSQRRHTACLNLYF